MQKDEIITIRTSSEVKRIIEEARNNSGQTAGDWLYQAVNAWQEKYSYMEESEELSSAHVLAGRKALAEAAKVLEALELASKQAFDLNRSEKVEWQKQYAELENDYFKKEEMYKSLLEEVKNERKKHEKDLGEKDKVIQKLYKDIDKLEEQKLSVQELSKHLEQERNVNVKLYNAKEKYEQELLNIQGNYKILEATYEQKLAQIKDLQNQAENFTNKIKSLEIDLLGKDREVIKLTINKEFSDNSIAELQKNIKTLNTQNEKLQMDNSRLIQEKGELQGTLKNIKNT